MNGVDAAPDWKTADRIFAHLKNDLHLNYDLAIAVMTRALIESQFHPTATNGSHHGIWQFADIYYNENYHTNNGTYDSSIAALDDWITNTPKYDKLKRRVNGWAGNHYNTFKNAKDAEAAYKSFTLGAVRVGEDLLKLEKAKQFIKDLMDIYQRY